MPDIRHLLPAECKHVVWSGVRCIVKEATHGHIMHTMVMHAWHGASMCIEIQSVMVMVNTYYFRSAHGNNQRLVRSRYSTSIQSFHSRTPTQVLRGCKGRRCALWQCSCLSTES